MTTFGGATIPPLFGGGFTGELLVSIPNGATNIWAGISIAQSKSDTPSVINSFFDFFLSGGTEVGFSFTRTQLQTAAWGSGVPGVQRTGLHQVSGDALDPFSSSLDFVSTFFPSGKKWWFSINNNLPGSKSGVFELTVDDGAGGQLFFGTFQITLIGT